MTGYSLSPVNSAALCHYVSARGNPSSPRAWDLRSVQSVTINTTAPSATIYYTTNGTLPTTASAVYFGPIMVSASETIHAIAVATGTQQRSARRPTPLCCRELQPRSSAPASGVYDSAQMVTISTAVPSTIYYTTDRSRPTSSSPVYTVPSRSLQRRLSKQSP